MQETREDRVSWGRFTSITGPSAAGELAWRAAGHGHHCLGPDEMILLHHNTLGTERQRPCLPTALRRLRKQLCLGAECQMVATEAGKAGVDKANCSRGPSPRVHNEGL